MSTRKLKVGVIGTGGIAMSEHLPHWRTFPDAEVVAVADLDPVALRRAAETYSVAGAFSDWRDLVALPDLDVVDITAPNVFHAPMAIAAMEAGKHVLCEKPMAASAAEALRMQEAAKATGRQLMINHVFRFSDSLRALRNLAADQIGRIYHAHAKWTRRRSVPPRPTFIRKEFAAGGPLLDIGIHMIDLASWCMGFPRPMRVSASVGRHLAGRAGLGGAWGDWDASAFDVEDFAIGLVHFEGGATLLVETGWLQFQPEAEVRSLHLFGEGGGIHWPENVFVSECNRIPYDTRLAPFRERSIFEASIHAFAQAVLDETPVPIPTAETAYAMKIIDALYLSAAEGKEVEVEGLSDSM